jgi:hypothetical protein
MVQRVSGNHSTDFAGMAIAHKRVQKGGSEIEPAKHRGATELNDSDEFRTAGRRISAHVKVQRRERTTMAPEPYELADLSKEPLPF